MFKVSHTVVHPPQSHPFKKNYFFWEIFSVASFLGWGLHFVRISAIIFRTISPLCNFEPANKLRISSNVKCFHWKRCASLKATKKWRVLPSILYAWTHEFIVSFFLPFTMKTKHPLRNWSLAVCSGVQEIFVEKTRSKISVNISDLFSASRINACIQSIKAK